MYLKCPILKKENRSKCSTCHKFHHTSVHDSVLAVEAKMRRTDKSKTPWRSGRTGTTAYSSDLEENDEDQEGFRAMQAYKSMVNVSKLLFDSDAGEEVFDDELDLESVFGRYLSN